MIYDTIIGQATASGMSALNIIRLSGDEAISLVAKLFQGVDLTTVASHSVHYGHLVFQNEILDEVLVSVFKSPRSFTTEDVVEISCHGGVYIASRIIETLISLGARMAEPGEFTRRAYLNGRIDLTQAESIMDVIQAKTKSQLRLAHSGLSGDVRNRVHALQNELLQIIAVIEVNIDYPEYDDVVEMTNALLIPKIRQLIDIMDRIIERANTGKVIRNGIKTVIVGKPNVGKSSLLNTLLQEDRAIVTDISGTTRDLIQAELRLGGLLIQLIDTAGVRDTTDLVEQIGISKTKKAMEEADLVLLVLDQSKDLTKEDIELLQLTRDKKRIIVGNKSDLGGGLFLEGESPISISAKTKAGIDALEQSVKHLFDHQPLDQDQEILLGNARHIGKILETKQALQDALRAANDQLPVDFVEMDLKKAWRSLGDITGEASNDQLISTLFSSFCLGK